MYVSPTADYAFWWRQVLDGDRHFARHTADEVTVSDAIDVYAAAAEFVIETLHPLNAVGDREGSRLDHGVVVSPPGFAAAYDSYVKGGWVTLDVPATAGGDGMPHLLTNPIEELWSAGNAAFTLCTGLSKGAMTAIAASGSDEQRATFLKPMLEGRWTGTMNLTEPQAGTDLASIRTTARPVEDGSWRLKGQKIFITWGDHELAENIVHLVLARTPDAPPGLAGLSLFIVPKFLPGTEDELGPRNSVTTVALEHKLGIHASPTCVLEYEDATGFLLGEINRGLAGMFVMMNVSRIGIGVQGLGIADRAFQQARDYAQERVQGRTIDRPEGTPIAGHPDVQRLLGSAQCRISAMRGMLAQVSVWQDDAGAGDRTAAAFADFLAPVVKGWFTEEAVGIASDALQVHGGAGFIEETGVAQHYRDVRIAPIYEGTTAIQANDLVGRKLVRDAGSTASALLSTVQASVDMLRQVEDDARALRAADRLQRAVDSMRAATRILLDRAADRPRDVAAAGVPYLTMWGLLIGGWMLARGFIASQLDGEVVERRGTDLEFFGAHHLSRIASLGEAVEAGEIS